MTARNLVTGGAGFLGRHLRALLRHRGEAVRVLDVREEPRGRPEVNWLRGSVTDRKAVRDAVQGVDRVYHLAAKTELWGPDERAFDRVNRYGSRLVFREALEAGVDRLVHVSTEAVLRDFGRPWREISPTGRPGPEEGVQGAPPLAEWSPDPDTVPGPYCRSKARGELEARRALRDGLPLTVVNPTVPVGPGDPGRTPPSRMLLGFLDREVPGYTPGRLDLVDVRDLARGLVRAAVEGEVGARYVLGGRRVSVRGLLQRLSEVSGRPMPRLRIPYPVALGVAALSELLVGRLGRRPPRATVAGVRLLRAPPRFDDAGCRARLGLSVRPLEETLSDTVRWFRQEGLTRAAAGTG